MAKPSQTTFEDVTLATFGGLKLVKTNYKNPSATWFSCEAMTTTPAKDGSYGTVQLHKNSGGDPKLTAFTNEILDQESAPVISVPINGRTQRITDLTDCSNNWSNVTGDNFAKLRDALIQGSRLIVSYTDFNYVKQPESVPINGSRAVINMMTSDCEL